MNAKTFCVVIVSSALWSEVNAQCSSNACQNCPYVNRTECTARKGFLADTGGQCGCCPACVIESGEGGSCDLLARTSYQLRCFKNLTCHPLRNICLPSETAVQQSGKNENIKFEEDGTYSATQCNKSHCYCVDPEGKILGYSDLISSTEKMHCKCAFEVFKTKFVTGEKVACTSNGNYQKMQCFGRRCYCVHVVTGDQIGSAVSADKQRSLHC